MSNKAFVSEGFAFKDKEYRAMTASSLAILEQLDSPFFTGDDKAGVKGLLDYLLCHSLTSKEARKLARNKDKWDDAAFDLGDEFSAADLEELGDIIAEQNDLVASAIVEPGNEGGETKKK